VKAALIILGLLAIYAGSTLIWLQLRTNRTKPATLPEAARTLATPPDPGVIPPNSIFHKPDGADCPSGTTLLAGYFSSEDGSIHDACFNPNGNGSIDYLNPGEGFKIPFRIQRLPEQERSPRA